MPISDAAVMAANSSRELLTPRSPTKRTLEPAADGGLSADAGSFCGFVWDMKVLNTNDRISVMLSLQCEPPVKNRRVSRVCLHVCRVQSEGKHVSTLQRSSSVFGITYDLLYQHILRDKFSIIKRKDFTMLTIC